MTLSRYYKYSRYSPILAKLALNISATSAIIDIIIPKIERTAILIYIVTSNITKIKLSSHYNASAIGRAL